MKTQNAKSKTAKGMIYLNLKTVYGVETVDELNRKDYKTFKEYKKELKELIENYYLCNMNVYKSQRCTKEWNN